ncbi:nitrous oxide reductase accessory protein NosL [Shewanella maritima]|uniref:Nitrous oxide reductase accessory protein NosL n=1 Tax=Shewanella maritima TaxID=2520507 RepID=A0A411PHI6_9GAMM|nr:nitrous oxide reductase accessory protein NosL [Shewanella maritima]QBF82995.1 nitrous oxide reductase accessory protein NosL [Shewanella maritima]
MKHILLSLMLLFTISACSAEQPHEHDHHHVGAIGDHERCHMCGMMITKYPGPKGQIMFNDSAKNPKFCSTRDMFNFALQPENQRKIGHLYVHDMAKTSWEKPSDEHFIDAKTAWYVYGTSRKAVMGSAVATFSTEQAATEFAREFGGVVLRYDDISLELLAGN